MDALDECTNLLGFVDGLRNIADRTMEGTDIRLLITSRHEVSLERAIKPFASFDICLVDYMREDIKTYLITEVQKRIDRRESKLCRKDLSVDIQSALEKKAGGM